MAAEGDSRAYLAMIRFLSGRIVIIVGEVVELRGGWGRDVGASYQLTVLTFTSPPPAE